ncbi:MAG: hypothetical protein PW786_02305 [Arachidicoccus sp.]|nr:hypothetical protein [Arachidicoccus sp.]
MRINIRHAAFTLLILMAMLNGIAQRNLPVKNIKTEGLAKIAKTTIPVEDSFQFRNPTKDELVKIFVQQPSKSSPINTILPVLTLLLGIGLNRFLDWHSKRRETKKQGERWIAELATLSKPIKSQIQFLNECKDQIGKDIYGVPALQIASGVNSEALNVLDKSELINYLRIKRKRNLSEAVQGATYIVNWGRILSGHYKDLNERYNDYLTDISKFNSAITESLQGVSKDFAYYQLALEKKLGKDPIGDPVFASILALFDEQIFPFMDVGIEDLSALDERFIEPMTKIIGENRHNELLEPIQNDIRACVIALKGLTTTKGYLLANLEILIKWYQQSLDELIIVLGKFEIKDNEEYFVT